MARSSPAHRFKTVGTLDTSGQNHASDIALLVIAILWLGILIGVSFIATPVKFRAPSLDLPVALDVGRVTFSFFSRVEWALCLVLGVATLASSAPRRISLSFLAVLALILLMQGLWLLPVLDQRIGSIIAGNMPSSSNHHFFYVITEAVKVLMLLGISAIAFWRGASAGKRPACE